MVVLHSSADTVIFVAHSDRGHFQWVAPLGLALKAKKLKVELWTNGMCEAWLPDPAVFAFDRVECSAFGSGEKLNTMVSRYKGLVAEGDSDAEGWRIACENNCARFAEVMADLHLDMAVLSVGSEAGKSALAARVKEADVAFVVWEAIWGSHAAAASKEAGKPHLGICPTFMRPFRAAYCKEPVYSFDMQERVRDTKEDIESDAAGEDACFVIAKSLRGKAHAASLSMVGALLPTGGEKASGLMCRPIDGPLEAWLGESGRITVVSMGSQSLLAKVSAWAEADLLKGCLAASPRVLVASSAVPEDPELRKAEADGKLRAASWLPLYSVLCHSNVGCFVSHCGANSSHEALASGTAIVPLPFFDDQYYIADIVEELMGYTKHASWTPLRKALLRKGPAGSAVAAVEATVRAGLDVPTETTAKLKAQVWKDNGAVTLAKKIKATILATPRLQRPKFSKVRSIRPDAEGLNLLVKVHRVVQEVSVDAPAGAAKVWEAIVGDASGIVTVRLAKEEHAKLCENIGASLRIQNARVQMSKAHIRVVVDKWGALKAADPELTFEVSADKDVSAQEWEQTG